VTPLVKANPHGFKNDDKLIKKTAKHQGISIEEATKVIMDEERREAIWVNEKYQVAVARFEHPKLGPCMQINIRRRDGKVLFRDWRDFQEIKNQLAGPECEGVEIYPAESRKVDTSNKYHIWCVLDENLRIPFGWDERDVHNAVSDLPGHRQRPLPKGELLNK
jgi:hypothetical protein